MSERFFTSALVCPACESDGRISYTKIPEHRRHWSQGGEEFTDYFGPSRDYHCADCDAEWMMQEEAAQ